MKSSRAVFRSLSLKNWLSVKRIFAFELISLSALSFIFTYIISSFALKSPTNTLACDLGYLQYVPYIYNNIHRFCAINLVASYFTAAYFLFSFLIIAASSVAYKNIEKFNYTIENKIMYSLVIFLFLSSIFVFSLGLSGVRGDYEFLTKFYFFKSFILVLFISTSQLAICNMKESK